MIARWTLDDDGDLTLSIMRVLHVTFYKWADDPVVTWGRKGYKDAPKDIWRRIHS